MFVLCDARRVQGRARARPAERTCGKFFSCRVCGWCKGTHGGMGMAPEGNPEPEPTPLVSKSLTAPLYSGGGVIFFPDGIARGESLGGSSGDGETLKSAAVCPMAAGVVPVAAGTAL